MKWFFILFLIFFVYCDVDIKINGKPLTRKNKYEYFIKDSTLIPETLEMPFWRASRKFWVYGTWDTIYVTFKDPVWPVFYYKFEEKK